MRWRRGIGAVLLAVSLTGCAGSATPTAVRTSEPAAAGLAAWQPPADAPPFCAVLARAVHVEDLPEALGRLLADPTDAQSVSELKKTIPELRAARDAVRWEAGHEDLAVALDDVAKALTAAVSGAVDQPLVQQIADELAAIGGSVQPVCEYPA
jgi:hypothetical protein